MKNRTAAFLAAMMTIGLTAGYVHVARWEGMASYVAAALVVLSWLVLIASLPILFSWTGELLRPMFTEVLARLERLAFSIGSVMKRTGIVLYGVGVYLCHQQGHDTAGGGSAS